MAKTNKKYQEELERQYQESVKEIFDNTLRYHYLGNWQYAKGHSCNTQGNVNSPIYKPELKLYLESVLDANQQRVYTDYQIEKAIEKLEQDIRLTNARVNSLREKNDAVYEILLKGVKAKPSPEEEPKRVKLFNFTNFSANRFAYAEEVSYIDPILNNNRRPDIVIYVNGIALAVVELKRALVSVSEAIRQHNTNQKDSIPCFFTTTQFCVVSNKKEFKYGTICTPEKFFCPWKNDTTDTNDILTSEESYKKFFDKETFMFLFRWSVLSDNGRKKVMRPHQYHALKAAIPRLENRASGVVWHSQGSGKSLTMIWLTRYIKENFDDAKIVIITDRTELDIQLSKAFGKAGHSIKQAESQIDLLSALQDPQINIISSLIHKFGLHTKKEKTGEIMIPLDEYIKKLKMAIKVAYPNGFNISSNNVFVFIDECHRTQGGRLHEGMREIMGKDVMLIGFTGTPLLVRQKEKGGFKALAKSSEGRFGEFIHKYLHKQAVKDEVILDLRYEARDINKHIDDKARLQTEFDRRMANVATEHKEIIKKRWATMEKIYSSNEPIERIFYSINDDMQYHPLLTAEWCNAMLVADSVYSAYKYYKFFQTEPSSVLKDRCAVVTSFNPGNGLRLQSTDVDGADEEYEFKQEWALKSFEAADSEEEIHTAEQYEAWAKKKFIEKPYQMKLLIVVDKLLTGFDAPNATVLYIDQKMRDHTLFQAICRVNRLGVDLQKDNDEPIISHKEYGLIVDFKHLFNNIEQAIADFNDPKGSFSDFDQKDIAGLMDNFVVCGKAKLDAAIEAFDSLKSKWESLGLDNLDELAEYYSGHSDEEKAERLTIYKTLANMTRNYVNLADYMGNAGYSLDQANQIMDFAKEANEIHKRILLDSGDFFDPTCKDKEVRELLDRFIRADNADTIIEATADFSFLDMIDEGSDDDKTIKQTLNVAKGNAKAAAEIIKGKARQVINDYKDSDPMLFTQFAEQLQALIVRIATETNDFMLRIKDIIALIKKVKHGGDDLPKSICNKRYKKVLWRNRNQWTTEADLAKVEKSINDIEHFMDNDVAPDFTDANSPDYEQFFDDLADVVPGLSQEQYHEIFTLISNNF